MLQSTRVFSAVLLTVLFAATPAAAQEGPPLQAEVVVAVPATDGARTSTSSRIDGGNARVRVAVTRLPDVVQVDLRFRYRIPEDTIALDEILHRIEIETLDGGEVFSKATIDPNDMNLNPNRVPLRYRATLYRPDAGGSVRMRLFGNYE